MNRIDEENLVEVLRDIKEALNSDNPKDALKDVMVRRGIPLPDEAEQSMVENIRMMRDLAENFTVITCIINQRVDDLQTAMDHVMAFAPGWIDKNHHCRGPGDHDKYMAKYLLMVKHQAELALGYHQDEM